MAEQTTAERIAEDMGVPLGAAQNIAAEIDGLRAEIARLKPAAEAWEAYEQLRQYPMPPKNAEGEQVDAWHIGVNKARERFEAAAARARKEMK